MGFPTLTGDRTRTTARVAHWLKLPLIEYCECGYFLDGLLQGWLTCGIKDKVKQWCPLSEQDWTATAAAQQQVLPAEAASFNRHLQHTSH